MLAFLSSPSFWASLFTFLIALYFSFLAGRAMLRCEQLAKRVQVLEDFKQDVVDVVGTPELQRAVQRLRMADERVRAQQQQARTKSEEQASLESITIGHTAANGDKPEFARRKAVADRILKDLVHSRTELDKAWEHLIEIGATVKPDVQNRELRQTVSSMIFGLLALHHVVAQFMGELSFMRDLGASGYLKFPGFIEHFRKAAEAEDEDAKRTVKEQSQCTS